MVKTGLSIVLVVTLSLTNRLLVSAPLQAADSVTKPTSELDTPPSAVMVDLCIAELLPNSRDGKTDGRLNDASAMDKVPAMAKDGAAWLAWVKKHGRLEVLSQAQIMTLDNQPAFIKISDAQAEHRASGHESSDQAIADRADGRPHSSNLTRGPGRRGT
jgi:type II secretory pathway component GspD/PulD (secretin)